MWFRHQEIPDPENGMWVIQSYVCMPMNLLVTPTETKIKVSKISTLLCWELYHLFHFSFDVIAYKFIFHSLKWTVYCEDSVLLSISIWSFPFGLKTMKIHRENQISPIPPTSHAPRPKKKNICSETYCQLQRTNRKSGPLSGVNASHSLNLSSNYWICNDTYAELFKGPDGFLPKFRESLRSFKITVTSTLNIYQTKHQSHLHESDSVNSH